MYKYESRGAALADMALLDSFARSVLPAVYEAACLDDVAGRLPHGMTREQFLADIAVDAYNVTEAMLVERERRLGGKLSV